jgi:hypothetical protein
VSAWIKSYQSLRDHPKTRKLARRVGGTPQAIGHLHCLWWWALDYAPDGDLSKHDVEDLAIACEWDGDPAEIIGHLTACGFLDNGAGLHIHDWWEYGESLIQQREVNRARARASYEKKKAVKPQSTRRLRADYAQSAGLDRKIDRKKELRASGPVDNSTVRPAARSDDRICWRCSQPITGDDILDDKCVSSHRGIRHKDCKETP